MRTIDWVADGIELVDQTLLPGRLEMRRIRGLDDLIFDISRLAVRGAPALGVAGAFGVALVALQVEREGGLLGRDANGVESAGLAFVRGEAARLASARPTAVNLSWGVGEAVRALERAVDDAAGGSSPAAAVLDHALALRDRDIAACREMGVKGAQLALDLCGKKSLRAMTICNTGGLATVERGTALGVIQTLHERGALELTLALETRPLLQGARLTAWELSRFGAPHRLLVDSAGPFLLSRGAADIVFIGADRIAANGDTANKIGSFSLALAAKHSGVPFVVVAPESTVDEATPSGEHIEIEDRGAAEVTAWQGVQTAPADTEALNPAFDVTPASLITAIVTERRIIRPKKL